MLAGHLRGAVDVHLHQIVDAPEFFVKVDRIRAAQLGLTEASIATDLGTSLSSSFQTNPNFWTDPANGIPYQVAVQTPEYRINSLSDLVNTPLLSGSPGGARPASLLSNVATLQRQGSQTVATHSNTLPSFAARLLRHHRGPLHHRNHPVDTVSVRRDHERRHRIGELYPAGHLRQGISRAEGCTAAEAAIAAGETRLRPVLMTAGAMFVGLIPVALGLGEGSEQNAALAIGTCSTLLLVPLLYGIFRCNAHGKPIGDYI
jgi:multidrug efflux pump subunit AcrB